MTIGNLRIVAYNDHDDATLTPSVSPLAGFESELTQDTVRTHVLRTVDASGFSVTGVVPETRTASHFSMHRHLCQAGDVQLQLYSDAGASTQVYDSTAVSGTPYTASEPYTWSLGSNDPFLTDAPFWLWFAETAYRSYKITFSGTPSQSYWQVSRIWLGRYFEAAVNPTYGMLLGRVDQAERNRSRGGSLRTNNSASWRTLDGTINEVSDDEFATWMDIMARAGTGVDMVVSVFPGDGTRKEALHTMAGKFSSLDAIGRQVTFMTKRIQIEEN